MRRQISVWGCLWHLQWGSGVVWRPQAKIRQKRVIKVWIFRTLQSSCICKWGARQAAGFRQEPRRSATEVYRCFQRTGRPQIIKSAVVWFTWPFASSRTASFYPVQSKRWAANRGFPVDLFVWCRCISRNGVDLLKPGQRSVDAIFTCVDLHVLVSRNCFPTRPGQAFPKK